MTDNDNQEKKPFDHPDYKIGENAFNWSKWSRENIPKPPHKYKVGDFVTVTLTVEVLSLHYDVDGTPLYKLDTLGAGWNDDDDYMRPATQDEIDNV
jgi:hypothetical protein